MAMQYSLGHHRCESRGREETGLQRCGDWGVLSCQRAREHVIRVVCDHVGGRTSLSAIPFLSGRLLCPILESAAGLASGSARPVLVFAPTVKPLTGLTFDDGPHPDTTPPLLEVLARHDAKATFFLLGERAAAYPSLVADIVAGGHELGNHLWSDRPSIRLPADAFSTELARTSEELLRHGHVLWWRPGSGFFVPRMVRAADEQGLRCALGSPLLLATDYHGDHVRRGVSLAGRAHQGAIATFHEGTPDRSAVPLLTDGYLGRLSDNGLSATTLTCLTKG